MVLLLTLSKQLVVRPSPSSLPAVATTKLRSVLVFPSSIHRQIFSSLSVACSSSSFDWDNSSSMGNTATSTSTSTTTTTKTMDKNTTTNNKNNHDNDKTIVPDIEELHQQALLEGKSTYEDPQTGFTVFTELFHLKRGTCCGNSCRHCPYGFENVIQSQPLQNRKAKLCSGDLKTAHAMVQAIFDNVQVTKATTTTTPSSIATTLSTKTTTNTQQQQQQQHRSFSTTTKNVPYTRKGDTGTSQLGTGERRLKCDCNFEGLGTVDELCSVVGVVHAHLLRNSSPTTTTTAYNYGELPTQLLDIMSRLFDIGSHVAKPKLSVPPPSASSSAAASTSLDATTDTTTPTKFQPDGIGGGFDVQHVQDLECWINEMTNVLPELTSFILPTGAIAAAQLHVARTVCRRAERRIVPLVVEDQTCDPNVMRYLNRLSDYFFVAARYVNFVENQMEIQYIREHSLVTQRQRVTRSLKEEEEEAQDKPK